MLINIPLQKAYVRNDFITDRRNHGFTQCYVVAVRCIHARPLLFSVLLENGALFSGLPIHALSGKKDCKLLPLELAQPWSCLEPPANAITMEYLREYDVRVNAPQFQSDGRYLFTIDYHGQGLAQDPEQHKMHHIIETEAHTWVAMPNNYILWEDQFFISQSALPTSQLRRSDEYWRTD